MMNKEGVLGLGVRWLLKLTLFKDPYKEIIIRSPKKVVQVGYRRLECGFRCGAAPKFYERVNF